LEEERKKYASSKKEVEGDVSSEGSEKGEDDDEEAAFRDMVKAIISRRLSRRGSVTAHHSSQVSSSQPS